MRPWVRWSMGVTAAAVTAAMCVLAFTPLAWIVAGRPDETYPELVFFGIGLPSALVALVAILLAGRRMVLASLVRTFVLASACTLGLAICGVLVAMVALPEALVWWIPEQILAVLALAWPLVLVAVLCAAYIRLSWPRPTRE